MTNMAADNQKEVNEKLKAALQDSLNAEMELLPCKEEIKKLHHFSSSFRFYMNEIIKLQKHTQRNLILKKVFYTVLKAAACIFCILCIGTLIFTVFPIGMGGSQMENSSNSDSAPQEEKAGEEAGMDEAAANDSGQEALDEKESQFDGAGSRNDQKKEDSPDGSNNTAETEDSQQSVITEAKGWQYRSWGFDEVYYVEFRLVNDTDSAMSYGPVYQGSYTISGETTAWTTDRVMEETILEEGEEADEVFYFTDGQVTEQGGVLEVTRYINNEPVTLRFVLE